MAKSRVALYRRRARAVAEGRAFKVPARRTLEPLDEERGGGADHPGMRVGDQAVPPKGPVGVLAEARADGMGGGRSP
eukprot:7470340-Pyramimonas_sp.AAC.1